MELFQLPKRHINFMFTTDILVNTDSMYIQNYTNYVTYNVTLLIYYIYMSKTHI